MPPLQVLASCDCLSICLYEFLKHIYVSHLVPRLAGRAGLLP